MNPNNTVCGINGDQTKHWIDMTAAEFLLYINDGDLSLYKEDVQLNRSDILEFVR